ncbi:Uncharacterised protein [Raoultella terrigena]|uniref:Uncharacterized protein n=1 Tax=Raoultella terrigena TaxID=577 RepID=A0A4U9DCT8_RAOTE|nr:Uncharacterised protein [Raoultella terrigena]
MTRRKNTSKLLALFLGSAMISGLGICGQLNDGQRKVRCQQRRAGCR